ncbi:MAG: hypothetical protein ACLR4Z_03880 [Butyricicoccaceae bacterium]
MVVGVILLVVLAWSLRHQYGEDRFRVAPGGFRRRMMMVRSPVRSVSFRCCIRSCYGLFGVKTDVWDQTSVYRSSGAVAEFLRNTEFMEVEQPEDTAPETVSAIVSGAKADPLPAVSTQHPNIPRHYERVLGGFRGFRQHNAEREHDGLHQKSG